jgi:AraC-like DNA-binding protein
VALQAAGFLLEWLMILPDSPGKSLWLGLRMASAFFVGPCLWLFAREIVEGRAAPLRSLGRREIAWIVAGVALTLPLIQRAYWGPHFGDPHDVAAPAHKLLIQGTMMLCATLFLVQIPYYLKRCLDLLAQHRIRATAACPGVDSRSIQALRLLVAVVCVSWVMSLLRVLHCMFMGKDTRWGIVFALFEVTVAVVAVFTLSRAQPAQEKTEVKYAKSSLDVVTRARIRRKLNEGISSGRLHLDSRLTLQELCRHLRENPHYVSQVINQDLGTHFNDLINRHRIENAKAALVEYPEKSVLEIGLDAGFNAKSTFNSAFREHTGMTPTQYRRAFASR